MVSCHAHKLVQVILLILIHSLFFVLNHLAAFTDSDEAFRCKVLGETMHIITQYLANKVVMVNSKVEALEAEASGLRKDLVVAMDAFNTSKEQVKVLTEQLESEKQSVKQKVELLATTAQRMKNRIFHNKRTRTRMMRIRFRTSLYFCKKIIYNI